MALGKIAMQGPATYGISTADRAVDGHTSDAASGGACAHTTSNSQSWWKVDLRKPYLITGILIYNRERGGTNVFFLFPILFIF